MTAQRLWLDDERPPPTNDWYWARTVSEAILIMQSGNVEVASLDHDLGLRLETFDDYTLSTDSNEEDFEEAGYLLILWMAQENIWPRREIAVHSMNPVGAARMCGTIERYGPYNRKIGQRIFQI